MGTQLAEIYDVFMQTVTDYRLIDLFNTSQEDFENYLQAWLELSITDFEDICNQSLAFDDISKEFSVTLSRKNKNILAKLMMKQWLQKEVNNVTQFNLHVTDRDFRVASEAQNLREKSNYLITIKEDCSQMLQDYAFAGNDWDNWYTQEFSGV